MASKANHVIATDCAGKIRKLRKRKNANNGGPNPYKSPYYVMRVPQPVGEPKEVKCNLPYIPPCVPNK